MTRILQVSAGANPAKRHSNAYLDLLPTALADLGYDVTSLHMAEVRPGPGGVTRAQEGINHRVIKIYNGGVYAGLPPGSGATGVASPRRELAPGRKLRRWVDEVLDEVQPDVVHLQNLFGFPAGLVEIMQQRGLPVAMTEHGFYPICPTVHLLLPDGCPCNLKREELTCHRCCVGSRSHGLFLFEVACGRQLARLRRASLLWRGVARFRNAMLRANRAWRRATTTNRGYLRRFDGMVEMLHRLDLVHCISDLQAARLQEATGPLANLWVQPLASPANQHHRTIARHSPRGGGLRFAVLNVQAGRDLKGWGYLHGVLRRLQERQREFRVSWYTESAPTLPCIDFLGRYTAEDLDDIAAQVDACIMPSTCFETLGFSGLEMLARGVPLLCSNRCGAAQYVRHGETGFVFDPSVEEGLREHLVDLLDHPDRLPAMREAQTRVAGEIQTFVEHVRELGERLAALGERRSRTTPHARRPESVMKGL
jgi:glycosyltransferase involved in cell wall biosynthesis